MPRIKPNNSVEKIPPRLDEGDISNLPVRPRTFSASDWRDMLGATPKCASRTRDGTPCEWPAGYGTKHFGIGRCVYHDHGSLGQRKAPLLFYLDPELRGAVEALVTSDDLLDLRTELSVLRYRFAEINNVDMSEVDSKDRSRLLKDMTDLVGAMTKLTQSVVELERAHSRYVPIAIPGILIQAFADIGIEFVMPDRTEEFMVRLESEVQKALSSSTVREIAMQALLPQEVLALLWV